MVHVQFMNMEMGMAIHQQMCMLYNVSYEECKD